MSDIEIVRWQQGTSKFTKTTDYSNGEDFTVETIIEEKEDGRLYIVEVNIISPTIYPPRLLNFSD